MKTITDMIASDVDDSATPDLPALRYLNKPVKVFLWDSLSARITFNLYFKSTNDFKGFSEGAITKDSLIPWYDKRCDTFEAYCLDEITTLDWMDIASNQRSEPRQLRGSLVEVSLEGLCELDWFYENTSVFEREEIEAGDPGDREPTRALRNQYLRRRVLRGRS